jgi:hypothetical protein
MARYRAKANLFVKRLIVEGEAFVSDAVPGKNWEPLDDEAHAAVAARFGKPVPVPKPTPEAEVVKPALEPTTELRATPVAEPAPVAEPMAQEGATLAANWRSLHWTKQVEMAIALIGPFTVPDGKTQAMVAREMLEAEETRRS